MELLTELTNNQFVILIPVAFVIIVAGLVFTFGFKRPVEPKFDKLSLVDDRKPAGKKRKSKEKKTSANGHATNVSDTKHEKSPVKEVKRSPTKDQPSETAKQQKEKKQETNVTKQAEKKIKPRESIEESKNKKNLKKNHEKPVDFDDGDWETVISKSDKKKKQQESTPPPKKEKPAKKEKKEELILSAIEINKSVKEVVNKDLKEKINKEKVVEKKEPEKEIEVQLIPASELEAEEDNKSKKKAKKTKSESEGTPKAEKPRKEQTKKDEPKPEPPKKEKKPEPAPKKEETSAKENIALLKEPAKNESKKKSAAALAAETLLSAEKISETENANVAFDELGDTWTEAKAAKKSKKKARKDN